MPCVLRQVAAPRQNDPLRRGGVELVVDVPDLKGQSAQRLGPGAAHDLQPPVVVLRRGAQHLSVPAGDAGVHPGILVAVVDHSPGGLQHILRGLDALHHVVRGGSLILPVEPQVLPIKVHLPHGGAGGRTAAELLRQSGVREGDLGIEVEIPAVFVPVSGIEGDGGCPALRQQGGDVGLVQPPVPLEEDLGVVDAGGDQLPCSVAIQVRFDDRVAVGPGQQIRCAAAVHGVVVVEGGVILAVLLEPIRDDHAVMAQELIIVLHSHALDVFRQCEEALELRSCLQGGAAVPVGGAVDPEGLVVDVPDLQCLRHIAGADRYLHRLGLIGLQAVQGDGHPRISRRVVRGNGGHRRESVGAEPVSAVLPLFQRQAEGSVAAILEVRVIEADGTALPLPDEEVGNGDTVGVAVEEVVGVVLRQVLEAVQIHLVCFGQGQAGVLQKRRVHVRSRELGQIHPRVLTPGRGPPLCLIRDIRQTDAVVEEGEEVDVLRRCVEAGEELLPDVEPVFSIEEVLVEIPHLLSCERAIGPGITAAAGFLRRLGSRPGEGGGAYHSRQGDDGKEGDAHGAAALGNAGDAVLQLLFPRRHGGGGQQGVGGPPLYGDQREEGSAVRDALLLTQNADGPLVAGQLAVVAAGNGGGPHQRVEPVYREAYRPQKGPQGVQVAGVGLLVGQHVAQGFR